MNARQKAKKLKQEVIRLQKELDMMDYRKANPFQVNITNNDVVTVGSIRTISRFELDKEFVKIHLASDIASLMLKDGLISFKAIEEDYGYIDVQATAHVLKKEKQ